MTAVLDEPRQAAGLLQGAQVLPLAGEPVAKLGGGGDEVVVDLPCPGDGGGSGGSGGSIVRLTFVAPAGVSIGAEIWSKEPHRSELGLADARHVRLGRLAAISPLVKFPLGAGLPGAVWQTCRPTLVPDLPAAAGFLRTTAADHGTLAVGLGWPMVWQDRLAAAVVTLLATDARPLARRVSVWHAGEDDTLRLTGGDCGLSPDEVDALRDANGPIADARAVLVPTRRAGRVTGATVFEF